MIEVDYYDVYTEKRIWDDDEMNDDELTLEEESFLRGYLSS